MTAGQCRRSTSSQIYLMTRRSCCLPQTLHARDTADDAGNLMFAQLDDVETAEVRPRPINCSPGFNNDMPRRRDIRVTLG